MLIRAGRRQKTIVCPTRSPWAAKSPDPSFAFLPCNTGGLQLGWLTDIHLNFLSLESRSTFYTRIHNEDLNALLIGGEADSVVPILTELAAAVEIPDYFVLVMAFI